MNTRRYLIIGNWKLNGTYQMVSELVGGICKELINISKCIVVIAPPEIYLDLASRIIKNSNIILGAQNVDINLNGAFTGETSAKMLKDVGVRYVIIGHSERRMYHKESNELIAKKFAILKEQNLIPVLCIGETEEENNYGRAKEVCAHQIDIILKYYGITAFDGAVIAYEPIWAIGTGKSATPAYAQDMHRFIRSYIAKINVNIAEQIIIQYGGSVNASNAEEFISQPDIDGVLVGSASLKVDTFTAIVKATQIIKIT